MSPERYRGPEFDGELSEETTPIYQGTTEEVFQRQGAAEEALAEVEEELDKILTSIKHYRELITMTRTTDHVKLLEKLEMRAIQLRTEAEFFEEAIKDAKKDWPKPEQMN